MQKLTPIGCCIATKHFGGFNVDQGKQKATLHCKEITKSVATPPSTRSLLDLFLGEDIKHSVKHSRSMKTQNTLKKVECSCQLP